MICPTPQRGISKIAPGIAWGSLRRLRHEPQRGGATKDIPKSARTAPLGLCNLGPTTTQGVALGWHRAAPLGAKSFFIPVGMSDGSPGLLRSSLPRGTKGSPRPRKGRRFFDPFRVADCRRLVSGGVHCTPHLLGVACVENTSGLKPNIPCPETISVRLRRLVFP